MADFWLNEATAAARRLLIYLVDDTDGKTAKTGITISAGDVKLSKNGAAEANHGGTLTELAGGLYYYEFTAGELDTLGFLSFRLVKTGVRTHVRECVVKPCVRSGTAQAGASTSITLDSGASATDDFYNTCFVQITAGTGAGQTREAFGYVGSTKVLSVEPAWATTPDSTSRFLLLPFGRVDVTRWRGSFPNALISGRVDANSQVVGDKSGYTASISSGGILASSFAAGAIDAAALADATIDAASIASDAKARPIKNQALSNFMFIMVDAADHVTRKTGLTITVQRSLDGAAFAACANSAVEVGNGWYKINLAATDMNADIVALNFSGTGADSLGITLQTLQAA